MIEIQRKRKPQRGILVKAYAKALGIPPADVPDELRDDRVYSLFWVDMYGNVVATRKDKGPTQYSVCRSELDHVVPWCRGGLSKGDNVEGISYMANRKKSNDFIHGVKYIEGWTSGTDALNLGLSVDQFVSLWTGIKRKAKTRKEFSHLREKLVEDVLFKAPAFALSWIKLASVLSGAGIMHERPRGDLLKHILRLYCSADTAEDFELEAKEYMRNKVGISA